MAASSLVQEVIYIQRLLLILIFSRTWLLKLEKIITHVSLGERAQSEEDLIAPSTIISTFILCIIQ